RHLTAMSAAAFPHVDGLGTKRLLEAICPSSAEQLKLRPARDGDATVYFNWANDPEVRRNAFNSDMISWPTHKVWFASKLTDPCSHLFVLEAQTLAVGQIRFDRKHNEASIDYSLDRLVRGRGWAVPLVALGIKEFSGGERLSLRADVKPTNHDSIAVFRRLSFSEITRPGDETVRIFHKDTDPTNSPSLFSD
ncbi:MAG: N-acetyltransferase, partial [Deltaproteobacteria bacterium]